MAKCKKCGLEHEEEVCPKCGLAPGPETVTSVIGSKSSRKTSGEQRKAGKEKRKAARRSCRRCGHDIPDDVDICPKCGLAPGPETLTDYFK